MENEKKEIVTIYEMIFSVPIGGIIVILAILLASIEHNYALLSCVICGIINFFGNEKPRFCKRKVGKFILRKYPYTIKLILMAILFMAIVLSAFYIEAFVCSAIISIYFKEYRNCFECRKIRKIKIP